MSCLSFARRFRQGRQQLQPQSAHGNCGDEELPDENLIDLYELTDMIQEGASKDEIPQKYLNDLVTKVQRAAVAWESDSGEEPSERR